MSLLLINAIAAISVMNIFSQKRVLPLLSASDWMGLPEEFTCMRIIQSKIGTAPSYSLGMNGASW